LSEGETEDEERVREDAKERTNVNTSELKANGDGCRKYEKGQVDKGKEREREREREAESARVAVFGLSP
jgi:hypothetical protein